MAIIEKTGVLTYLDSDGNEIRLYPDSKSKTSDGADTVLSVLDTDWVLDETTGLYKQTFTVNGITSDSTPVIGLVPTTTPTPDAEIEAYSHIIEAVTGDSTLELYSDKALTIAIAIVVKGISAEGSTVADITNMVAKYNELKGQYDEVNNNLISSDNHKFQFATDGEGNYGYLGADDSFIPFRSGGLKAYYPLGWNGDDPYARYYKRILGGIIYDNSVADFSDFTNMVPMQITIKSKGSYTFAISCQSWGSAVSHGYGLYVNGIDKGTVSTSTSDPLANIITLDLNVGDIVKLKVSGVGSYAVSADLFMFKN